MKTVTVTTKSQNTLAIAECKRLRRVHLCPRKCDHWAVHTGRAALPFCKEAYIAEHGRR